MEKNKIKELTFQREYEGKYGKMFVYNIVMENNNYGEYQTKSNPPKYKVGDEVSYELTSREFNNQTVWSVKIVEESKAGFSGGGFNIKNSENICKQTALKCAVELVANGKLHIDSIPQYQQLFYNLIKP